MTDQKPNIYQRVLNAQKAVEYVKKDKQVGTGSLAYMAVTHDQVISAARSQLLENGILLYPVQKSGELVIKRDAEKGVKMHLYQGEYEIHVVNVDNPEDRYLPVPVVQAHAADNGDKAPGKALTYAWKAGLLKLLNLETGEDDESRAEREEYEGISEKQQHTLGKYCFYTDQAGALQWSDLGNQLCSHYGIGSLGELPKSKFKEALETCKARASTAT